MLALACSVGPARRAARSSAPISRLANFDAAEKRRFILREERTLTRTVNGSFEIPPERRR
jgi:hypothetical protein